MPEGMLANRFRYPIYELMTAGVVADSVVCPGTTVSGTDQWSLPLGALETLVATISGRDELLCGTDKLVSGMDQWSQPLGVLKIFLCFLWLCSSSFKYI